MQPADDDQWCGIEELRISTIRVKHPHLDLKLTFVALELHLAKLKLRNRSEKSQIRILLEPRRAHELLVGILGAYSTMERNNRRKVQ